MFVFRALSYLPFRVLYGLSDVLFVVLCYVVHYRRRTIDANLALAFPEASVNLRRSWRRAFYRHLCDVGVETIKLLHVSDEEMDRRVEVREAHLVDEAVRRGHSVVAFLGHYGNWEWNTIVTRHYSADIHTAHIYKPLHNASLNRFMLQLRGRFGSESIPQKAAVRRLLQLNGEGSFLVGVIGDHRPNSADTQHRTLFFGHDVTFNVGGETIGQRCGAEYLYLDVEKPSRGHYILTFCPLIPQSDGLEFPITRAYYRMLEATIRRQPPFWLWSHKRWKPLVREANRLNNKEE